MCWLQGEPTLTEVLADPLIHTMMRRDGIDADAFRAFLWDISSALASEAGSEIGVNSTRAPVALN